MAKEPKEDIKAPAIKDADKRYLAERKDDQMRIHFIANIRFDIGGNVIDDTEYKALQKNRDFKQIEKKLLDIKLIDISKVKEVKKALAACEAKPAKERAIGLLCDVLEDLGLDSNGVKIED